MAGFRAATSNVFKTKGAFIDALREDLQHYCNLANDALAAGDLELHMVYGAQFHRTADHLLELTGTEHRPSA